PVALGISGPWGSGKSTVLQLVEHGLLERHPPGTDQKVLVVRTDPWRYDPSVGAKGSLIDDVLTALEKELKATGGTSQAAEGTLRKLAKRVNWMKALKVVAKTSITLQLPSVDDITSLVSEEAKDEAESKTLDDFSSEFSKLLADDDLSHIRRVVVLVDDLDRCLPETVIDSLETMRLFLSVPKMSFVIAADEDRVADAIRTRYPKAEAHDEGEEPAKLYLHKIVQTTLRLPALSRFDTEAFLVLLLIQNRPEHSLDPAAFESILGGCTELRIKGGTIDDLVVPDGVDISAEMQFAARLTPMLYEKLRGSPRRVKRFLNDLNVRASIAERRGIELDIAIVAKLMILELLLPSEFAILLDWLARGQLRQRLAELEIQAGRADSAEPGPSPAVEPPRPQANGTSKPAKKAPASTTVVEAEKADEFSENFIRWAKLPPPLGHEDLSPYLHLAASFAGTALIDQGLPERLRDIAANLLSSSRVSQKSVADADLTALSAGEAEALVEHLGRMGRDRPTNMLNAVQAILRVTSLTKAEAAARQALKAIPIKDVKAPIVLLFSGSDVQTFKAVLDSWADGTADQTVRNAVASLSAPKGKK
ncbi:MAG: P-loop NTPase fold protein, partial [Dehalococcoidia bacterium]